MSTYFYSWRSNHIVYTQKPSAGLPSIAAQTKHCVNIAQLSRTKGNKQINMHVRTYRFSVWSCRNEICSRRTCNDDDVGVMMAVRSLPRMVKQSDVNVDIGRCWRSHMRHHFICEYTLSAGQVKFEYTECRRFAVPMFFQI